LPEIKGGCWLVMMQVGAGVAVSAHAYFAYFVWL